MHGRRGWGVVCALAILALAGCDRPIRADPPIYKLSALEAAAQNTRAEGSARTTTTLPEGMLPTIRVSGVVDFRTDRSDTLLEVEQDGRRLRYQRLVRSQNDVFLGRYLAEDQAEPKWQRLGDPASEPPGFGVHIDGISLLDAVETQDRHLAPAGDSDMRFERVEEPPSAEPAVSIHVVELDAQRRVHRVEFELTSMEGRHSLTYSGYGDVPPVGVPTPDV